MKCKSTTQFTSQGIILSLHSHPLRIKFLSWLLSIRFANRFSNHWIKTNFDNDQKLIKIKCTDPNKHAHDDEK